MSVYKIRDLAAQLHTDHTPDTYVRVAETLRQMGLSVTDMYQQMEMNHKNAEAFREEGNCGLSTPVHSHRFLELICCRSTIGSRCIIESEEFPLNQGDILVVPPGVSHAVLMPEDFRLQKKHYVLWISMDFLAQLAEEYPFFSRYPLNRANLLHTAGTPWEHLELSFRTIVEEWESKAPGWEPTMTAITVQLLVHISRAVSAISSQTVQQGSQEKQDLLNRLLIYVEANLAEKITLEETAEHFWISTTTLSSLFSKRMGISFYQYVLKRRLREARDRIAQGMPIENAAAKVGFSDYSAFYRAFRREYGVSPRQYRKNSAGE